MQSASTSSLDPQAQRRVWLGYAFCLIAAVILWLLIGHHIATPATDPFTAGLDVRFYRNEASLIRGGGLFAFDSSVHAYGYPLLVTLFMIIADVFQQPLMTITAISQFVLHVAAAWLALGIFLRLYRPAEASVWQRVGAFFLLVCNPILLAATHYMLSDSATAFWLTLILAASFSTWRGRWWIVGLGLGLCIVSRPYHQIWVIVLIITLLGTLSFFRWVQGYRVYVNSGQVMRGLLQVLVPVIVIVGLQYAIIYQRYGVFNLVGSTGSKAIQIHITGSLYYYRYETILKPDGSATGVRYLNTEIQRSIAPVAIEDPSMVMLYLQQLRTDPISLPLMALLKAVGMFQHYDFRLFLLDVGIASPLAFLTGLGVFFLFVVSVQEGVLAGIALLRRQRREFPPDPATPKSKRPRDLKLTPQVVLFWVIVTYVGLYAVATVPEPRFIFPIFPAVTILGFYVLAQPRPVWQRLSAVAIAVALYMITVIIVLPSSVQG